MLGKTTILKTLDGAYAARARGDKKAVSKYWAPGARYHLIGGQHALSKIAKGPAKKSVEDLMALFKFKSHKRLSAIVDGNNAVVRWRVKVAAKGKKAANTEICDFWKFNNAGKAVSLTQYTDTALIERLIS